MDQCELNSIVQKWLESLLHPEQEQENTPGSLAQQSTSQDLNEVLGKLRHLLRLNEIPKTSLRAGGTHLVVLARSIAAYLQVALDIGDLDRASRTFNQQTTKALMTIFKLTGKKLTPFYHDDRKDGITRAAQMALYAKYKDYAVKGAAVFHERAPVFYISDTGFTGDLFNLCGTLGIAMSSCRLVPSKSGGASFNVMDVSALEKAMEEDMERGQVPVMVVAYAGTPLAGHVEDMAAIRDVCNKHTVWMHVLGHALSSLCLPSVDQEVVLSREADSLTLYPGVWFGLLSSPCLTLHRTPYIVETELMEGSSDFPPSDIALVEGSIPIPRVNWNGMVPGGMLKLLPLSLWLCIQYLGSNTLVETVSYCHNLTQHMIARLDEVPGIKRFNVPTHESFTVLFKYFGGGEVEFKSHLDAPEEGERSSKVVVEELALPTCNIANAMIARDLQAYFPKVGVSPLKLPAQGVGFRFDPINSFPEHSTSLDDVDKFIEALKKRIESLHITALARRLIETELAGQPNLRCLEFPSFFGSGFIQYVPTDWANKTDLTLEEVSELNQLNIELSNVLAQKNPAFSPFQHGNFSCIMIKELQPNVNLQEFIDSLFQETTSFDENREFLKGMSEKIKQGIEAAQTDLVKEKALKEQEEGYLRYVPIVGSVLNWFSPGTPTTPQGRTFNLSSGKVADTTTTYKFKMQLNEGQNEAGASSPQAVELVVGGSTPTSSEGGPPVVSISTEEAPLATPDPSVVGGGGDGEPGEKGKEEEEEKEEEGKTVGDGMPESLEQTRKEQSDS